MLLKTIGAIVVAIAVIVSLTFGYIRLYRVAAPEYQDAQREVFEQSQSYVHGKATYISRLRLEFETAITDTQKEGLRKLILSEASSVDVNLLSSDTRNFLRSLQSPTSIFQGQ